MVPMASIPKKKWSISGLENPREKWLDVEKLIGQSFCFIIATPKMKFLL